MEYFVFIYWMVVCFVVVELLVWSMEVEEGEWGEERRCSDDVITGNDLSAVGCVGSSS